MSRLTSIAVAIAAGLLGLGLTSRDAFAQQADLAIKLNDEGKELMYAGNYAAASAKFRDAVARVPEPKYFFNLCTSLFQEGKFSDAMTACDGVGKNSPTPELAGKAKKLMERIEAEAKIQNVPITMTGGGGGDPNINPDPNNPPPDPNNQNPNPDPNNPPPQPQYAPSQGRPPAQGLFMGTTSDNKYTWTLGVDLYAGGGRIGQRDAYGSTNQGVRIKGDYLLNPAQRFGAQGYIQFTHFQPGADDLFAVDNLDIFDVGIAGYKHVCLAGTQRLCITPLAGVQLALMSPNDAEGDGQQVFNYTALGFRLEVGAHYAFGTRYEHVLGVTLGTNIYTAVFSESMDASGTAMNVRLDKGGASGYLGVGYTYRFNTPLGSSPFVTLE